MAPGPDPSTIDEIVAQQRFLRSVARQLVRDAATADDVVQETYLRALDATGERPRRLRAWLGRVVANLARDRRRGEARRDARERTVAAAAGSATAAGGSPAAIAARVEMHRRLADRVLQLAPAYRDVVLLHHFEGRTVAETAARLGIPHETARTRLRRALETLRGELEVELGGRDELLSALLPLATFVVPAMPPAAPPHAPTTASTTATAVATGGALIGVPLAMSTTTKIAIAAVLTAVAGGVWLWSDATLGDPLPRLDAARAAGDGALDDAPSVATPAAVDVAAQRAAAPPAEEARDAALPQPGRAGLRVRTVWSDARPAPRVRLRLEADAASDGFDTLRRATTDDAGFLLLDDLEPGKAIVGVAGYPTRRDESFGRPRDDANDEPLPGPGARASVALAADRVVEATLTLPAGEEVRGRVVDGSRRPIEGAEIWVSDCRVAWSAGDIVARSDASGEFTLPAAAPWHYAAARAEGLGWSEVVSIDGNGDDRRTARVELQIDRPGATVRGVVRDGGGHPIAGALLLAYDHSRGSRLAGDGRILGDPPPVVARSGADGTYRLDSVPFGTIALFADHPRFAPREATVEIAQRDLAHDFTLEGGGTLELRVVDERGFAVEGATAHLQLLAGPMMLARLTRAATTGADGRAAFDRLPASSAFIAVRAPGRVMVRRALRLDGGANREEVALAAPLRLRGRVVDEDGHGCARVRIEIAPAEPMATEPLPPRTTDAEGRFEFDGCADVPYLASLYPSEGMSFIAAKREVELRPGPDEIVVVLDAAHRATASIRGRVVAADGEAIERASVQFAQVGGHVIANIAVQPDGRFEVGPLPAGSYWLVANCDGLASRGAGNLVLAPGEARDLGDLTLARPATLIVRARRFDGQRVKPTDVELEGRDGGSAASFALDGERLRADGLGAGEYALEVVGDGLAWQRVAVQCKAGVTTEVDLELDAGVDVDVTISRRDGAALGATLQLTATGAGGEAIGQELRPIPEERSITVPRCLAPGEWTLEVIAPDGARAEATLQVARGAKRPTVELALAK